MVSVKPKVQKVRIPFYKYEDKNQGFKVKMEEYSYLINKFMYGVTKTWGYQTGSEQESSIGNSGYSVNDFKQLLLTELYIGLTKYDPNRGAAENTFIFRHLYNKAGVFFKKYTARSKGYGTSVVGGDILDYMKDFLVE